MSDTNLVRFRAAVAGALAHLESRRQEVNDLNVFPVADGDTGDNMTLTLRAVVDELDRLQGAGEHLTIDEIGRDEIVQSVARAALLGARGNSGVILSQMIRGAAEELVSRPGELIDATLVGAALTNAASRAYASVREPAEGTILTVAREMAHKIVTDVAHSAENPRLGPATDERTQDVVIADALERAVEAGQDSVRRGPELLAALRDAGVVDAGGYGLTIIMAGVVAVLRGERAAELEHHAAARIHHPEHSSERYRYCTNFAVTGQGLHPSSFIEPLERLGDSVLVVGDDTTLKIHLHTDEPEQATAVFSEAGEVSRLDVADMHLQVAERDERLAGHGAARRAEASEPEGLAGVRTRDAAALAGVAAATDASGDGAGALAPRKVARFVPPDAATGGGEDHDVRQGPTSTVARTSAARCGAVAVASGRGMVEMFHELGVHTIEGGLTFNPSTYDLLAGIHEVPVEDVVVLANSPNVIMAAERAAELSDKQVLVVRTTSQQAGLAAALALAPECSVEENAQALRAALARVRTAAVAPAARDDSQGRFSRGQAVGFVDDEVRVWGKPSDTLRGVLEILVEGGRDSVAPELITVLAGAGAPLHLADVEGMVDGGVELELRHGGQPAYWWLLAAE
ncbi:MAG TPA: DAK2 domain-containing protein [Solirubrobacteraceae bacterium]|nr:DAK2 domain-containing protein [Solirubrobacteraceae bacterium]